MGEQSDKIKFSEKKEGKITTYIWKAENLDKTEYEANAPSPAYYAPHLVVYINEVNEKGKKVSVLGNVESLYNWYSSLVKDVNKEEDKQLKKITDKLVANAKTDEEKIKNIFQWVQKNIKYVAFEDGLGGFVPREASDVCTKKYGDCKDMSSIIVEMLEIAGLDAHLTWIGSRERPYSYHDVPSPIADNHMIAATKLNGKMIFLDATGDYLPFGLPTSMIQGKEALVGITPETYEIIKVPVIPKERNMKDENIELSIEGRNLKGKAKSVFSGYKKVFAEYAKMRADNDGIKNFFDAFLLKGTNKFEITDVNDEGFFNPDKDILIDYSFNIPDYVKVAGDKMYINLNLDKSYRSSGIDLKERKQDIEKEFQFIDRYHATLQIPEGYQIEYLPPEHGFSDPAFGFSIKHEQKADKINIYYEFYSEHLMLKKKQFKKWNDMVDALIKAYQEVVVLAKK